MLSACDPLSGQVFKAEDLIGSSLPTTTPAAKFVCVDSQCQAQLVWKPGHGGRTPHWAHRSSTNCAGSAMSAEHKAMQVSVLSWNDTFNHALEAVVRIPASSQDRKIRRVDVGIRFCDPSGASPAIAVECQNSTSSREREEERILDLNTAGYPVLLAVSSRWVADNGNGSAKINYWVRDWANRHGRRQFAVIDAQDTLWWVIVNQGTRLLDEDVHYVRRVPIEFGTRSSDGRFTMGLCVDHTNPSSRGVPSLLIAAPAWLDGGHTRPWPRRLVGNEVATQPARVAMAKYLGSPGAFNLFAPGAVLTGGF